MKFAILTLLFIVNAFAATKPVTVASLQSDFKSADLYSLDRANAVRETASRTATDTAAWSALIEFMKYRNSKDPFLPSVQGEAVLEMSKLPYRDESLQAALDFVKRSDVQNEFRLMTAGEAALGNLGRVEGATELRKVFLRVQGKQSSGQEYLSQGLEALYALRKICEANPGNPEMKTLVSSLKSSINDPTGIVARAMKVDEIEDRLSTPQHQQTAELAAFFDQYLSSTAPTAPAPAATAPDIAPALKTH